MYSSDQLFGRRLSMERILTFRFDVDTELCLREGAPRLAALADRLGVGFTFFVNPGRSIRRRDILRKIGRQPPDGGPKLPVVQKMGYTEAARLFARNPATLPRHASVLADLGAAGHDLGLHGGQNHAAWARCAAKWAPERLAAEVDFGLAQFDEAGLARPILFASPGWQSPPGLTEILAKRGFSVLADAHGPGPVENRRDGIMRIRTAICGEPGGIGYLEYMRARGTTDGELVEDFRSRLAAEGPFACVYDHPFYAGRMALRRLEMLIDAAREEGWTIAPMSSLLSAVSPVSNR